MTVRMQEAEAAQDFSRFLDHLEAGYEVELEREGRPAIRVFNKFRRPEPSHLSDIEREQQRFQNEHGPVVFDENVRALLLEARSLFNQPLELRSTET